MNTLEDILNQYKDGTIQIDKAMDALQHHGFEEVAIGRFDTTRQRRTGLPEAIFAQGKEPADIIDLFQRYLERGQQLIATRLLPKVFASFPQELQEKLCYHQGAHILSVYPPATPEPNKPSIMVISAGTSDRSVAMEAAHSCALFGNPTQILGDVGVAGLHRLLSDIDSVHKADVLIVVAGMDGALPSVVAGLTRQPIIAVPTSVGYGAAFGGIAPLLTMLNSCAPGVTVVNIDNGFGAAAAATKITLMMNTQK